MAMLASPSVKLSLPFPLSSSKPNPRRPFTIRATEPETPLSGSDPSQPEPDPSDDAFDDRINQLRLRYRSGTGKKAELRKNKKSKKGTSGSGSGMYLPPVPLKEPVSGGVKVELGFSQYSERLNGRIAILGLAALVLVELATGKGVINYHTPAIILIQIYFVAAVGAVFVKYEKEKISVWPQTDSSTNK
ncbi:hypothetical protein AAZX31_04G092600 [Glycine max]|uniref:Uncharacterized protein n=2 Tax=Glycine subgen. Soja TaxID=1462606 RepID=I1JV77_SOYBN|nr:uncharacterized protein LOC100798145 [Glycine max]XP_028228397.1 uncharacterized protein LOC114409222 [Glycine soja]KAG5034486.1 hypothetical protein JHK87_009396 [Glycine soja]KAG5048683.1 hypothetical protein JHK85_009786 [Glycine max]KAG5065800.1 hypothetical protein JHK86_009531 [Glycine max]KAH1110634.1 hypothetical protein GYH30_009449 [Glycine max]KAH1253226.1 hypothetical protein GmHk_04G009944 [Glycine max]|eukprot:XP_003522767.1 uncharacterized protein LOC100798145 [Glycine max]